MNVRIIEHDPAGVIHVEGVGDHGTIEVIANLRSQGDTAFLDRLHIDGPGAQVIGLRDLRRFAREFGRLLGVRRIVIQGGLRTTGGNPGRIPRPIVIRVEKD